MSQFVFAALVIATAMSGGIFKPGPWYETLKKPGWTPANWVFPVVWTPLYIMIGIAGWLVWNEAGIGTALILWGMQLLFNFAWSALFFGLRRMDWAFIDVIALWFSIAAFIVFAIPISLWAALLFVPYLAWVTTAAALNWQVWRLNVDVLSDLSGAAPRREP